jgi:hypothetical protein
LTWGAGLAGSLGFYAAAIVARRIRIATPWKIMRAFIEDLPLHSLRSRARLEGNPSGFKTPSHGTSADRISTRLATSDRKYNFAPCGYNVGTRNPLAVLERKGKEDSQGIHSGRCTVVRRKGVFWSPGN